jgi:hypothetical protein
MMGFTAELVRGGKMGLPGARGDFGEAVPETIVSARSRAFCSRGGAPGQRSLFQRLANGLSLIEYRRAKRKKRRKKKKDKVGRARELWPIYRELCLAGKDGRGGEGGSHAPQRDEMEDARRGEEVVTL